MKPGMPPKSLSQAKHLQLLAHDVGVALRKDLESAPDADARAQVARALRDAVSAFDTARNACRILRNRGLPKAVDALKPPSRKQAKKAVFIEDESEETKPGPSVKQQPATTTPHNKFKESTSEQETVPTGPPREGGN